MGNLCGGGWGWNMLKYDSVILTSFNTSLTVILISITLSIDISQLTRRFQLELPSGTRWLTLLKIFATNSGLSCWLDKNSLISLFITSWTGRKSNMILGSMVDKSVASHRFPLRILNKKEKSHVLILEIRKFLRSYEKHLVGRVNNS